MVEGGGCAYFSCERSEYLPERDLGNPRPPFSQNSPPGAAPSGQLHRLRSLVSAEAQPLPRPSTSQVQFPNPSLRGAFSQRHPSMHCDVMRLCDLLCEKSDRTATGLSSWSRVRVALCECRTQRLAESRSAELDTACSIAAARSSSRAFAHRCQSNRRARRRHARGHSVAARFSVSRPERHAPYSFPAPGPATRRRSAGRHVRGRQAVFQAAAGHAARTHALHPPALSS